MTLHQLRIFEAVARFLNVTNAARELHVSQPAVSLQLKLLEEEFNAKFFERSNHGVELTTQGRAFLEAVRPALDQLDRLETDFKLRGRADKTDSLAVGGNNTLTEMVLPPIVVDFKAQHPDVRLTVHTADSPTMEGYVLDAKVDIALITLPSHAPNCIYEPFEEFSVVAFVPRDSVITSPIMSLEELVRHPLVVRRGSWIKEILRRGLKLNFALECDSPQTVKSAVRRGLGMGILSRARLEFADDRDDFHLIDLPELRNVTRKSYIIYDKRRPLTAVAQDFLTTLRVSRTMNRAPVENLSLSNRRSSAS
jgi:DNA-binding transcriptional LysR family regulator